MSDAPARPARTVKLNVINEPKDSYTGGKSSLCPGCGHDQISNVIIAAAWENGIQPHRIAKMSGIGCSSKTPAYYLGQSHGFNTVHGRMPSVTTGAYAINKDLLYLGVSGDGDSASIGIGQDKLIVPGSQTDVVQFVIPIRPFVSVRRNTASHHDTGH